jgi:hypothetical protein
VGAIETALIWLDALRAKRLQFLSPLQLLLASLSFHSAKV